MLKRSMIFAAAAFSALCGAAAVEPVIRYDFETAEERRGLPDAPGVSGRGLLLTDRPFVMPSRGKISPAEGTLSLWIKPLDWDMSEKEFKHLLSAEDTSAQKGRLILYKYKTPGLGLVFLFGANGKVTREFIYANKNDPKLLERDKWNFIAAAWSKKKSLIALNVNGRQVASARLKEGMFFGRFTDFVLNAKGFSPRNPKWRTVYDTVCFFDRALEEKELSSLCHAQRPVEKLSYDNTRNTIITLPKIKTPPLIDGNFVDSEWASCARLSGFTLTTTTAPALQFDLPADVYAGTDGEKLYFCVSGKLEGSRLRSVRRARDDGSVCSDDAVEFHLLPPGQKKSYHLIFNAVPSIFDRVGDDRSWNGAWTVKSGIYESLWIAEVSVPLSEFKHAFRDGEAWKFNFCRDMQRDSRIVFSSVSPNFHIFRPTGVMRMDASGICPRFFVDHAALADRKLDLALEILNPSGKELKVEFSAEVFDAENRLVRRKTVSETVAGSSSGRFRYEDKLSGLSASLVRISARDAAGASLFRQDLPLVFSDEIRIVPETDIAGQTLTVDVDCSRHSAARGVRKIRAELLGPDGRTAGTVLLKGTVPATGVFSLKGLPVGDYTLVCRMFDEKGKEILVHTQKYSHIGRPAWLTRKAGTGLGIPWPYTPLVREGRTLRCLGRTHRFGGGLLPDEIVSAGQKLFDAPPRLTVTSEGKTYTADKFDFKVKKETPEEIGLDFRAEAGPLRFSGTLHVEFDGFFWYDLDAAPRGERARIDALTLSFFLPRKIADMYNAHFFSRENRVGRLTGPLTLKRFPSIWAGNLDAGLTFVTESFEFWRNADPARACTLTPEGDRVRWDICFIDRPTELSRKTPFRYGFGIEANPVKPTPPEFRSWRVYAHRPYNIAHPWQVDKSTKKYPGDGGFFDPTFKSREAFLSNIETHKKKNALFTLYLNIFLTSPDATEFKVFGKEWHNPYNTYPNCPNSSFTDYIVSRVEELVRAGLQCVYVDSLGAVNCYNPLHGCGYKTADGKVGLTYPVRAARNYMKRLYCLLHAPGRDQKNNFLWAHMSARTSAPINAFVDFQASGEEVEYRVMEESNYLRLYPLDEFQIYFLKSTGVVPCLLPNLGRVGPKAHRYIAKYNDQIMLQVLLHDTLLWMAWCDEHTLVPLYNKLDAWGYADPDLEYGSYRLQKAVTCEDPRVKISFYRLKKAGKALVVIGNTGEEAGTFALKIDAGKLGIGGDLVFSDLRTGKTVDPARIALPGFGMLLLDIRKK